MQLRRNEIVLPPRQMLFPRNRRFLLNLERWCFFLEVKMPSPYAFSTCKNMHTKNAKYPFRSFPFCSICSGIFESMAQTFCSVNFFYIDKIKSKLQLINIEQKGLLKDKGVIQTPQFSTFHLNQTIVRWKSGAINFH